MPTQNCCRKQLASVDSLEISMVCQAFVGFGFCVRLLICIFVSACSRQTTALISGIHKLTSPRADQSASWHIHNLSSKSFDHR